MKLLTYLALLLLLTACGGDNLPIVVSKSCSIDVPVPNTTLPAAQNFNIAGWAFDEQSGASPEPYRIQITSTNRKFSKIFTIKHDFKRMDVAQNFNTSAAELSGFNLEVPANSLTPGKYQIVILQNFNNAIIVCGSNAVYQVK